MTKTTPQGLRGHAPEDPKLPLILDLLAWLAPGPQPYAEVMDVWRTSCPRLTIWEDAVDGGLVVRRPDPLGGAPIVELTPLGRQRLSDAGRHAA